MIVLFQLYIGSTPFSLALKAKKRRKDHISAAYADNFFLPFARLEARTFLPPGVLILALNP